MTAARPAPTIVVETSSPAKQRTFEEIMVGFISSLPSGNEKQPYKLSQGDIAELRRITAAFIGLSVDTDNRLKRLIPLFGFSNKFDIPITVKDTLADHTELNTSKRWALWMHCCILLKNQHEPGLRVGAALAEIKYSQARLLKLLNARDNIFTKEMISAACVIKSVDLIDLGKFIITKSDEKILRVASDYYKNIENKNKEIS